MYTPDTTRTLTLHGTKVCVLDPGFGFLGRTVLRVLARLPRRAREAVFFGPSQTSFRLQKTLQRVLGGPHATKVKFIGGPLEGRSFECWTSEKYFVMGATYETKVLERLTRLVSPGSAVYDIGAHAGYWTLLLRHLCGPAGRVVAFEPSPNNFARLQRNVCTGQDDAITPVNLAVTDHDGTAILEENGSQSRVLKEMAIASAHSLIQTIRLDTYVYDRGGPPPNFVKIDIEGAAGACLEGMRGVLSRARPRFLLEIHDEQETKDVAAILAEYSYDTMPLERSARYPWHLQAIPRS
jgi:FkbM family methyltransferase